MVRLHEPAGQSSLALDPFANPESKSNCHLLDLAKRMTEQETTDNDDMKMADPTGRPPSDSDTDTSDE